MNPLAPVVAVFLPAAIVAAEHYAPWRRWLRWLPFQDRSGNGLPRVLAYVIGTLAFMVPATAACKPRKHRQVVAVFWTAAASAGVTTLAVWGIDRLNEHADRADDDKDRLTYGK